MDSKIVRMNRFELHHVKKTHKIQDLKIKKFLTYDFKINNKVISIKILVNMLDIPIPQQLN